MVVSIFIYIGFYSGLIRFGHCPVYSRCCIGVVSWVAVREGELDIAFIDALIPVTVEHVQRFVEILAQFIGVNF